jgi:outer membrane receptor protein involved in Fe transport
VEYLEDLRRDKPLKSLDTPLEYSTRFRRPCRAPILLSPDPIREFNLPSTPNTFTSDSLWQYEIGAKNTLADHRLQVSAALYYIDWKNIQQLVYLTCGLGFNYNLGDVTGKGGDLEITGSRRRISRRGSSPPIRTPLTTTLSR